MAFPGSIYFTQRFDKRALGTESKRYTGELGPDTYVVPITLLLPMLEVPSGTLTLEIIGQPGKHIYIENSLAVPFTEVATPPLVNEFNIDYTTGILTFNAGNASQTIYVSYYGTGSIVWADDVTQLQNAAKYFCCNAIDRDGGIAMCGNLNMGGEAICNVGVVDYVRVCCHKHTAGPDDAPKIPRAGIVDYAIGTTQIEQTTDGDKIQTINIANNAITCAKLCCDPLSLYKVSGGAMCSNGTKISVAGTAIDTSVEVTSGKNLTDKYAFYNDPTGCACDKYVIGVTHVGGSDRSLEVVIPEYSCDSREGFFRIRTYRSGARRDAFVMDSKGNVCIGDATYGDSGSLYINSTCCSDVSLEVIRNTNNATPLVSFYNQLGTGYGLFVCECGASSAIFACSENNTIVGRAFNLLGCSCGAWGVIGCGYGGGVKGLSCTNCAGWFCADGDYGVYGTATTYGVYGTASSKAVYGIAGYCGGYFVAGADYGVVGLACDCCGVVGCACIHCGVVGYAYGDYGVYGSATTYGVYGTASSMAVYGTGGYCAGYFVAGADYGVVGLADDCYGVVGCANLQYGVYGFVPAAGNYAVWGQVGCTCCIGLGTNGIVMACSTPGITGTKKSTESITCLVVTGGIVTCLVVA